LNSFEKRPEELDTYICIHRPRPVPWFPRVSSGGVFAFKSDAQLVLDLSTVLLESYGWRAIGKLRSHLA
jgi:hypothetical protein